VYYNVLSELLSGPLFLYALEEVRSHHLAPRDTVGGTMTSASVTAGTSCSLWCARACGGCLLHVFINPQVNAFTGAIVEGTLCVQ
jgi:hypothetical protein